MEEVHQEPCEAGDILIKRRLILAFNYIEQNATVISILDSLIPYQLETAYHYPL